MISAIVIYSSAYIELKLLSHSKRNQTTSTIMSWKEVEEEMDKIEQIVESLETEDDKLEKGLNESEVENEETK